MNENVNHPKHYNIPGRKECIVEMIEKFGVDVVRVFCELNAYKYKYRHELKNGQEDLEKARWYEDYALKLRDGTTKNDLGVDCISRQATINAVKRIHPVDTDYDCTLYDKVDVMYVLDEMPSVTPQNQVYPLCEDCHTKMDEVRRAYDNAMKQEPVLDKINKMKSEIADSLEFWDYSPNNNPLARDMLETLTNFWGDMREVEE